MPSLVDSMRLKADQATLEADKMIRIRREQGAIDQLRRDIKAQLDALSQAALTAYRAGEIAHPQLVSIGQQVDALNEQIGQREGRIEQIRAEKLATPLVVPLAVQAGVPCPSCKRLIPDGAAFCPVCGYKIPKAPPAEATCHSCGSPMPAAAQFCPSCGAHKAQAPDHPVYGMWRRVAGHCDLLPRLRRSRWRGRVLGAALASRKTGASPRGRRACRCHSRRS